LAQQTINLGAAANDGTGDTLRDGGVKINDNFTELYAADVTLASRVTTAEADIDVLQGGGGGSAYGIYPSTVLTSNTGTQNATALQNDVTAAAGRRVVVGVAGTYTFNLTTFTSQTVNIEFSKGVLIVPDIALHTITGKMFQASSCNTRLWGLNVDGQHNATGCWRSDFGTLRMYDAQIINMGFLDTIGGSSHIGTYGILVKTVDHVTIDGYVARDFWGLKDGSYANNSGKVNPLFIYECFDVVINNVTVTGGIGEDYDPFHILDLRPIPRMHGTISNVHVRYNGQNRRCLKFQGGQWDLTGVKVYRGTDFVAISPGQQYSPVTGATNANPAVITATSHGFSNGHTVTFAFVGGMTQLNGNSYTIANATANTFELSGTDSSAYGVYTSGGESRRLIPITGVTQANPAVVTSTAHGLTAGMKVMPQGIVGMTQLNGHRVTNVTSANPAVVTSAAHGFTNGQIVTFVNVDGMQELNGNIYTVANAATDTFELSGINSTAYGAYIPSGHLQSAGEVRRCAAITAATRANPAVITAASHGFTNGQRVKIRNVIGMHELNDSEFTISGVTANTFNLSVSSATYGTYSSGGTAELVSNYTVANVTANTFELTGIDSSGFTAYSSGGVALRVTDVGQQNLNCIDWAGGIEDWLRLSNSYIDATGFPLGVTHSSAGPGKIIVDNCEILVSTQQALRQVPDAASHVPQIVSCAGFYTIGGTFDSELRNSTIFGGVSSCAPQGARIKIYDNTFDDPVSSFWEAGSSTARDGLEFVRNRCITRTLGWVSVTRCARIQNNTNIVINDNELIQAGNTTHAAVFIEASNGSATGRARNNIAPSGTVPFKSISAANIAVCGNGRTIMTPLIDSASIGNVTTGEDNLNTHAIPAYTLNWGDETLVAEWHGTKANNANTKTVKLYIGATLVATKVLTASVAASWLARLTITSTGVSTQRCVAEFYDGGVATAPYEGATLDTTEVSTASITVKATGEATSTNDIVNTFSTLRSLTGRVLSQ
jgi:hypothetical protein